MAFDVRINGEHAKIVLSGDVDLQTTSDLKTEITKISGVSQLEIDASSVTYIDSSGVAVLLLARQHCQQNNVTLSLPIISAAVNRVLEIAKLDRILPIGQVIDSAHDNSVMGLGDDVQAPADDDLVSELLADAPSSAPASALAAAPASALADIATALAEAPAGNMAGNMAAVSDDALIDALAETAAQTPADTGNSNESGPAIKPGSFS